MHTAKNIHLHSFLEALGKKLLLDLTYRQIRPQVTLIENEGLPIRLLFYGHEAANRIIVNTEKRLIHIDEDSWMTKPILLVNRILGILGRSTTVHARETVSARIPKPVAIAFQEEHHLQIALPGKYRYGLFLHGELLAIAVFSGGRKMRNTPEHYRSFELLRFCHKGGVQVQGGFSKLLSAFRKDFRPGDIMTYADRDWSDGSNYANMGFEMVGETAPQKFWVDTQTGYRYAVDRAPVQADDTLKGRILLKHNLGSFKMVKRESTI